MLITKCDMDLIDIECRAWKIVVSRGINTSYDQVVL